MKHVVLKTYTSTVKVSFFVPLAPAPRTKSNLEYFSETLLSPSIYPIPTN